MNVRRHFTLIACSGYFAFTASATLAANVCVHGHSFATESGYPDKANGYGVQFSPRPTANGYADWVHYSLPVGYGETFSNIYIGFYNTSRSVFIKQVDIWDGTNFIQSFKNLNFGTTQTGVQERRLDLSQPHVVRRALGVSILADQAPSSNQTIRIDEICAE